MSAKQIMETARGQIGIEKLSGPGRVYRLRNPAKGIELNYFVDSLNFVETSLTMHSVGERTTFAILCNLIHRSMTGAPPEPAYPRPRCPSVDELIAIMRRLSDLTFVLAAALPAVNLGD